MTHPTATFASMASKAPVPTKSTPPQPTASKPAAAKSTVQPLKSTPASSSLPPTRSDDKPKDSKKQANGQKVGTKQGAQGHSQAPAMQHKPKSSNPFDLLSLEDDEDEDEVVEEPAKTVQGKVKEEPVKKGEEEKKEGPITKADAGSKAKGGKKGQASKPINKVEPTKTAALPEKKEAGNNKAEANKAGSSNASSDKVAPITKADTKVGRLQGAHGASRIKMHMHYPCDVDCWHEYQDLIEYDLVGDATQVPVAPQASATPLTSNLTTTASTANATLTNTKVRTPHSVAGPHTESHATPAHHLK